MSAVSATYFVAAPECLHLSTSIAYPVGIVVAVLFLGIFLHATRNHSEAAHGTPIGHAHS
jgi:hypothetical protein